VRLEPNQCHELRNFRFCLDFVTPLGMTALITAYKKIDIEVTTKYRREFVHSGCTQCFCLMRYSRFKVAGDSRKKISSLPLSYFVF